MKQGIMTKHFKTAISLLLVTMATIFTSNTVLAQQRGPQGPPPLPDSDEIKEMVTKLSTELSLTKEQETKVSAAYFAHFDEVKVVMESNKGQRGGGDRKVMENLKSKFEKEVKSVLSKQQQKQFDAFQKENAQGRGNRKRPRQ